ncbi:hypothetical protein QZH41_012853 [Actinostola sp. cb2023]|nr:hypothetical protein QZH41_012853 [Actinostola sp. cb2023]
MLLWNKSDKLRNGSTGIVDRINDNDLNIKWQFNWKKDEILSCIHVEDIMFNGQRAVTEICVDTNRENIEDMLMMAYRGQEIRMEAELKSQLIKVQGIVKQLLFIMSFLDTSLFCSGFKVGDEDCVTERVTIFGYL